MNGNAPMQVGLGMAERDFSKVDKHRRPIAGRVLPPACPGSTTWKTLAPLRVRRHGRAAPAAAAGGLLPETEAQVADILRI